MTGAVAIFRTDTIEGEVVATNEIGGVKIVADFTKLPAGKHGFHIHKAGDLRGEGCMGLCEHYDVGHHSHGGTPTSKGERHTGDLGNIQILNKPFHKVYHVKNTSVKELWGRSMIVHEDEDDLGKGGFDDSHVTGHAGKRIGCSIFGRMACKPKITRTPKVTRTPNHNKTHKRK
uniref:Superoxide dismutase copper/zinc binding domain-containing protein n=1 Tax=viral metagenome TaxID=1070528 RepID=A0A6C0KRI6_9ZZZZ